MGMLSSKRYDPSVCACAYVFVRVCMSVCIRMYVVN